MIHEAVSLPQTRPAAPAAASRNSFLQRACSCGGGGSECEECKKDRMQRHSAAPSAVSGAAAIPSAVHETLSREGAPLDARTRAFMEPRFGHDFSRVRVHDDAQASDSARAVGADAYTGETISRSDAASTPRRAGKDANCWRMSLRTWCSRAPARCCAPASIRALPILSKLRPMPWRNARLNPRNGDDHA